MKLKIVMSDYRVAIVDDFSQLPGVSNNGQHPQLDGHILVDVEICGGCTILNLLHPGTSAQNGHVDLRVRYVPGKRTPEFFTYSGSDYHLQKKGDLVWPTGGTSLIGVLTAVESFLEEEYQIFLEPGIINLLLSSLRKK